MSVYRQNGQFGFSMIELLIGVIIMAVLMGIALPSFQTWLQNTQIRNAAESVANGLQRARAEAVARNTNVAFVLPGNDSSWTITLVTPASGIESRPSSEGSRSVAVSGVAADSTTSATIITFDSLGMVTANSDASAPLARVDLEITPGNYRNLRIVIGTGGNARMCDPSVGTGPSACN